MNRDITASIVHERVSGASTVQTSKSLRPSVSQQPEGAVAAIRVTDLTHRFGSRTALNALSLEVGQGEVFALLGPNGSGKTTLFRILATLLAPSEGDARVMGLDVRGQSVEVRRVIGVMFQAPSLDSKLTVRENLKCHGHLYGLHGRDLAQRIDEAMDKVHLADRARDRVEKLSGGLKRRVEVAKSLLHRPKVLLLDEPSVGLDPHARRMLRDQLEDLRQTWGVTSILTTHLMEEADTCDRIAIMDRGRCVTVDTPDRLKASVGGDVITVHSRDPSSLKEAIRNRFSIDGHVVGEALRFEHDRGHRFAADLVDAFAEEIDSVTVGRPSLEDVFIMMTGKRLDMDQSENGIANA